MRFFLLLLLSVVLSGCCIPMPSSPDPGTTAPTPPLPGPAARPATQSAAPLSVPPSAHAEPLVPAPTAAPPLSGHVFDTGIEDRARRNLVPQVDGAWELFGSLTDAPPADKIVGGLLLCDLRVRGTAMFRSRPDIQGRFDIGGMPRVLANAHNNRDSAVLSVPLVKLEKGDVLKVTVMDRDLFTKDDLIDGAQTTYPGHFPLMFTGVAEKLHGTCRHLDAGAVSRRLTPALAAARAALGRWEGGVQKGIDLAAPDLGYPWSAHVALGDGIEGVAALVGWSQTEVTSLRQSFLSGRQTWRDQSGAAAQEALTGAAPASGTARLRPVRVGPVVRRCGADAVAAVKGTPAEGLAPSCLLSVTVKGAAPALDLGRARLDLLTADGRTPRPSVLAATGNQLLIAESRFGGALDPVEPLALRLSDGRTATFLRLP